MWVRKGRKTVARRRGCLGQHIPAIVAVNAQGQATKKALLWNTRKIRGDMFLRAQWHAQVQNPELRNAEGLMTQPKKQPLVLMKPSLPPTKGMVQEIRLICMLATKVVVSIFGLESVCQRGPPKQSDAK